MENPNSRALVHLELCNNITSCDFYIVRGSLNIKYAINGTGKSTIAKALYLSSQDKPLTPLKPFQLPQGVPETTLPSVTGVEFSKVMLFDADYVSQYIFQPSDLVKDAFEVFIRNADYDTANAQIKADLNTITEMFETSEGIKSLIEGLRELCSLVKTNTDGSISRRQKGIKSVLEQQKCSIDSHPESLGEFDPFFSDTEKAVDWAAWKLVGIEKYTGKGLCPFCAEVETEAKVEQTRLFSMCFDKDAVVFTSKLKEYLEKLSPYIEPQKLERLLRFLSIDGDRATFDRELKKFIADAEYILDKLLSISKFSGFSIDIRRLDALGAILTETKINFEGLSYFETIGFRAEIEPLNRKIDDIIQLVSKLQESIASLHSCLQSQIKKRKKDIDSFLKIAGVPYSFNIIVAGDDSAHALLLFEGRSETQIQVDKPDEHLSWGERNAISLLLFMFDAISKDADLIILDDPISSFDSNKKYAIINRLFLTGCRKNSLYMRTVLLLTHDLEPIIDYIQVGDKLAQEYVNGAFLQNIGGLVVEIIIEKDKDILSTTILLRKMAMDEHIPIPARIGCLRKFIEHTVAEPMVESMSYNILSSLVHGRNHPTYDNDGEQEMSSEDQEIGTAEIKEFIPSFEYQDVLAQFAGVNLLKVFKDTLNTYIKLLILRAYVQRDLKVKARLSASNDVLRKYLDETFHIENDYMYSLDLRSFAIVPEYISNAAADFVKSECLFLGINI